MVAPSESSRLQRLALSIIRDRRVKACFYASVCLTETWGNVALQLVPNATRETPLPRERYHRDIATGVDVRHVSAKTAMQRRFGAEMSLTGKSPPA